MNILAKRILILGVLFFYFGQLSAQINLGSTETVLKDFIKSHLQSPKSYTFTSSKNTPISVNITDYYYENGQLSMTGNADGSKNSIMIFKGTKENLYGYVVMPDKDTAYEYTTEPDGNVIVNEVPVTKIIPICEFRIVNPEDPNQLHMVDPDQQQRGNQSQGSHDHENKNDGNETEAELVGNNTHIGNYPPGTDVTKLQSRPGLKKVFYMDITRVMNEDTPINMSKAEMWITWQIFASSLSMFDVNVTTDAAVYAATPVVNSGILRYLNKKGRSNAPIHSFGTSAYSSMYKEPNGYGYGRTTAHEAGHQLGLRHDGGEPDEEYYEGIPAYQWCPIMGNFWYGNSWKEALYQWSKGEYSGSSNTEDDLRIITSRYLPFRADDITEDTPIEFTGASGVDPTINGGHIGGNSDTDVFTFTIGSKGGKINVRIDRTEHIGGGMLDVEATLYNESGGVIVISNPTKARYADINETLTAGNYKLKIAGGAEGTPSKGFSTYSSMGFYGISGTITGAVNNNLNNSVTLSGPASFCIDEGLTLQAHQDKTYNYQWYRNDAAISQATSNTFEPVTSGAYYVTVSDGTLTSNSQIINITVKDSPPMPTASNEIYCKPGDLVELSATGTGGSLNWFESASSETILHTGETYSVNINEARSYFVAEKDVRMEGSVGPVDNTFGAGESHGGNFYLIFSAEKDLIINSVKVYATGAGNRKFVLKNSLDEEISSKTVNVADGESRVTLDFTVSAGTGLKLGIEKIGNQDAKMYRNSAGVSFPYKINGLVSITGSTAPETESSFYYYCYDWKVQEAGEGCLSPRKEVEIVLDPCLSIDETNVDGIGVYPNPTSGIINIKLANHIIVQHISLTSITGQLVFESYVENGSIDLSKYAKGTYLLQIVTNENTVVKRIIVK